MGKAHKSGWAAKIRFIQRITKKKAGAGYPFLLSFGFT